MAETLNIKEIKGDSDDTRLKYLISFLMILVDKAGGKIQIDNLSDYGHRAFTLGMDMPAGSNSVTLTTIELPKPKEAPNA